MLPAQRFAAKAFDRPDFHFLRAKALDWVWKRRFTGQHLLKRLARPAGAVVAYNLK
jgi:hypothetical protein